MCGGPLRLGILPGVEFLRHHVRTRALRITDPSASSFPALGRTSGEKFPNAHDDAYISSWGGTSHSILVAGGDSHTLSGSKRGA